MTDGSELAPNECEKAILGANLEYELSFAENLTGAEIGNMQ